MPAEPHAPVEPAASPEPGGAAAASEPAAPEPDGPEPAAPEPAGLARRFAAMFYDALLMAAALYAAAIPAVWVHGGAVPPNDLWFQAWLVFVAWFYLALSWIRGGQTLGMRAWRCRLVTADGGPVGWGRTVARFAAALVSWAPLGLGFWWSLADPDRRCWHDRWSGTRIVVLPR